MRTIHLLLAAALLVGAQESDPRKALGDALLKANPGYKGGETVRLDAAGNIVAVSIIGPVADLSPLKGLPLTSLRVSSKTLTDLSPLQGMKLTSVDLQASPLLTDLSALEGMPLEQVTLYACRALQDISPLKNARLRRINIEGSAVGDLSPLQGHPLSWARLCTNRISDVSPLAGLPLTCLDLTYAKDLADLAPLKDLVEMDDLRLDFISAADLAPVRRMDKLRILSILDCRNIRDLSAIRELKQLRAFIFTPKHYSREQIEIVRSMTWLQYIDVDWKHWNNRYCGDPHTPNPCTPAETFWKRYDAGEYAK
jgi:hypothetical protein